MNLTFSKKHADTAVRARSSLSQITGPYLDPEGKDLLAGGGARFLETDGPFVGPGHAGILTAVDKDWFSSHFYDGTQHGLSRLAIRPLRWNSNGWPVAASLQ